MTKHWIWGGAKRMSTNAGKAYASTAVHVFRSKESIKIPTVCPSAPAVDGGSRVSHHDHENVGNAEIDASGRKLAIIHCFTTRHPKPALVCIRYTDVPQQHSKRRKPNAHFDVTCGKATTSHRSSFVSLDVLWFELFWDWHHESFHYQSRHYE